MHSLILPELDQWQTRSENSMLEINIDTISMRFFQFISLVYMFSSNILNFNTKKLNLYGSIIIITDKCVKCTCL